MVTATALGGFTTGVSTLEMASAYSTLENDGMYRNPTCIKSIVDSDNNIIYTSSQKDTVIYTETASRMMTDVMTDVMKSGTGRSANLDNGMPSPAKQEQQTIRRMAGSVALPDTTPHVYG